MTIVFQENGYDITLEATSDITGVDGLTVYGGISQKSDQFVNATTHNGDKDEVTLGAKYAMGAWTIGYQWSEEDTGRATGTTQYNNDAYGITFSVNDDLSIGYNHYESEAEGSCSYCGSKFYSDSLHYGWSFY